MAFFYFNAWFINLAKTIQLMQKSILYLLLFFPLLLLAQEDDSFQRFPEGVKEAEYFVRVPDGKNFSEARIEPPHWWVGMQNPNLQILLYDKNIGNDEVAINYPGIELLRVHRVANPNYLFLDVFVGPGVQAGTFDIKLASAKQQRTYSYELRERDNRKTTYTGVDASDLIYLIMPDRFANGDYGNDEVAGMNQTGIDRDMVAFRHGGDLIGVMERLNYLEDLGVTALWLNPFLENDQPYESYHGYAITDHYQVDPRLGTNDQYRKLVQMCHERGIKVIMDIIHNHAGDQHWFIKDLPSADWIHQSDSFQKTRYRAPVHMDPYAATSDKQQVIEGWFDNHMPDLNHKNPLLANYLIQNHVWWTEFSGHDGYRIDTYAYCDQKFMAEWGKRIKAETPGVSFFGETWVHGAPVQAQFTQNSELRDFNSHLPGVTDYQMYYAILEALEQEQGWTSGVTRIYYTLTKDALYEDPYENVIFLDNHDLGRIYDVLEEDFNKFKSAIALLMTQRGIPLLYYGTEILMKGKGGAFGEAGRRDFPGGWKEDSSNKFESRNRTDQENEAFNYIRALAQYRKKTPALQKGKLTQFIPQDGFYVYFRHDDEQTVMVIFNSNDKSASVGTERFKERLLGYQSAKNIITGEVITNLRRFELDRKSTLILELQK